MTLAGRPSGVLASVVVTTAFATAGDRAARAAASGPARLRMVSIQTARSVTDPSARAARPAGATRLSPGSVPEMVE